MSSNLLVLAKRRMGMPTRREALVLLYRSHVTYKSCRALMAFMEQGWALKLIIYLSSLLREGRVSKICDCEHFTASRKGLTLSMFSRAQYVLHSLNCARQKGETIKLDGVSCSMYVHSPLYINPSSSCDRPFARWFPSKANYLLLSFDIRDKLFVGCPNRS